MPGTGRKIYCGWTLTGTGYESGCYVKPCIAEVSSDLPIVQEETFAPILYIMKYSKLVMKKYSKKIKVINICKYFIE